MAEWHISADIRSFLPLVSRDDTWFHGLSGDDRLVGKLAGDLANELVEQDDSRSGG
jgi:hypothetical protein